MAISEHIFIRWPSLESRSQFLGFPNARDNPPKYAYSYTADRWFVWSISGSYNDGHWDDIDTADVPEEVQAIATLYTGAEH